ncbi:hypothetical protein B0A49_11815, partial [Cryomyces minteri]
GNGFDIYDLYDLGEFDQKDGKATKWGTKEQLMDLMGAAKEKGVGVYWDAVLNHKAGADDKERCQVVEVDENGIEARISFPAVESSYRTKTISDPYEIEAWVKFDFLGRGDKHSKQKYRWYHFTGTDFDAATNRKAIFQVVGDNKGWSNSVDKEQGNADYMMFADLDYSHQEVIDDVKNWGTWIVKETGIKGFRLDAVQHFSERFTNEWVEHVREQCGKDIFCVGEFWVGDVKTMTEWLEKMGHKFSLFDAPLLYNFSNISKSENADLRKVFDNSLVQVEPVNAVTVVMNHDTQPGQTVATPVEGFFKPLAYSLILLRNNGYPCLFYGDLYGMRGNKDNDVPSEPPACGGKLADLTLVRKLYAYGDQEDYFNDANCIGFVRRGTWDKPNGCAVVMSNAKPGEIRMAVGREHKGECWTDVLGWEEKEVKIDDEGYGVFPCPGVSVSVYVKKDAEGRDRFPVDFDANIYKE